MILFAERLALKPDNAIAKAFRLKMILFAERLAEDMPVDHFYNFRLKMILFAERLAEKEKKKTIKRGAASR